MSEPNPAGSGRRRWALIGARAFGLGVVYVVLSQAVQLAVAFGDDTSSSVLWPAAGVTVAALLLRPRREWPTLLGAVWVAETGLDLYNGFSLAVSLGWGAANAIEPAVAALALTHGGRFRPEMGRRDALLRFVGFAVLLGPAVGASIGAVTATVFDGHSLLPRLPRWYIGDAIGVLMIAPALLVPRGRLGIGKSAIVPLLVLGAVVAVALGPWAAPAGYGGPYLVIPAIAVVALRTNAPTIALVVLGVGLIVEITTAASSGPFGGPEEVHGLIEAQLFLAMTAFTCWAVATLTAELLTRERVAAELFVAATRDDLTGLANRRQVVHRLEQIVAELHRRGGAVTVLFVDLDGFKAVNDVHGHAAGDEVLVTVGHRLRDRLREVDTVGRLGGDEFIVVSADCNGPEDAANLADRVGAIITEPVGWSGGDIHVGASIGVVHTAGPVDGVEGLLDRADRAMYQEKLVRTATEGDLRRSRGQTGTEPTVETGGPRDGHAGRDTPG